MATGSFAAARIRLAVSAKSKQVSKATTPLMRSSNAAARGEVAAHAHADQHDLGGRRVCTQELVQDRRGRLFPFGRERHAVLAECLALAGSFVGEDRIPALD